MTALTDLSAHLVTTPDRWDGGPFPFFLIPLMWLLVIALVATLIWTGRHRRDRSAGRRAGEQRLAERLADGAIDAQEYRALREILRER